ncbi:MAG: BACON domain-containing protein, partial [Bacteroidales bacterium]|nr:BACON domain-containing protein [Bacteroidales bacterium]
MKTFWRTTALLFFLALCVSGCMKGEKEKLVLPSGFSIEVDAVQDPYQYQIVANFLWNIECSATWLNFSPSKAYGDREIEIHVSPNTSLNARQVSFFIVGEQTREEVKVRQNGEAPAIILVENAKTLSASGAEVEVEVSTNLELDITSNVPWITRIWTKAMSSSRYYFNVEQNTNLASRVGIITFKQKDGSLSQVFTITQQGETPDILLSKNSFTFDAAGGMGSVDVTANIPWTKTVDPSKDWLKIIETKLMETSSVLFSVEENKRADPRDAVIIFSREGSLELNRTLSISQLGASPIFRCVPNEYDNIPSSGTRPNQKELIIIDANFDWIVDHSGTASWITDVTFDGSTCTFRVSENGNILDRSTQIIFKQVNGLFTRAYNITQKGTDPQINILPVEIPTIHRDGGSVFLFVNANVPWEFDDGQTAWMRVERGVINSNGVATEYLRCTA